MNNPPQPAFTSVAHGFSVLAGIACAGMAAVMVTGRLMAAPAAQTPPPPASASPTPAPATVEVSRATEAQAPGKTEVFPDFSYVIPRWQPERDFKRVSEYFTGREDTGGDIVVRTDSVNRSGMYFRIGLPVGRNLPEASTLLVEYIRGDSPGVRTRTFELPSGLDWPFAELRAGITGIDWPDKKMYLTAWRLTLKDAKGKTLFRRHSFLWELPPEKKGMKPAPEEPAAATATPAEPQKPTLGKSKKPKFEKKKSEAPKPEAPKPEEKKP